jgi:hypothetical protein
MSSKKKKPVTKVSAEPVVEQPIDPAPPEDVPSSSLTKHQQKKRLNQYKRLNPKNQPKSNLNLVEVVAEPAPTIEPVVEVKPQPVVEPTPVPPAKPKPLTMTSLHAEIEELRKIVDGQAVFISSN